MDTPDNRFFAGFRVDLSTGELATDGGPVPMERQPARALAYLVRHAGRLVSREELRRAVWDDDTHVDFERGVNYCVRQIRIALDDEVRVPRFVQTVPRQGYRFIAPVSAVQPSTEPRRPRRMAVALTLAAVLGGLAVVEVGPRNDSHHAVAIAVLHTVHDFLF